MKMNLSKKTIISLFIGFIMLGSTAAYAFMQGFRWENNNVEVPNTNIINHELTQEQENALAQNGKTILKFYYSMTCDGCLQKKNVLENSVNDDTFSKQLVLEEITSSKPSLPMLVVLSYKGQKVLGNYTNEELIDSLCDLMVQPPVGCAVRKV
jgi:hypothetical protein